MVVFSLAAGWLIAGRFVRPEWYVSNGSVSMSPGGSRMPRLDIEVPVPDGRSKGTLHIPEGDGPWPGVLVFPDAAGVRETFRELGDKLADLGYVVLVPDIYYRAGDWAPFDIATVFKDDKERARLMSVMGALTNDRVIADANAYADFLLARPEVSGAAIGTTGYCMGGRLSLVAAGGLGRKIAAAASFHGGRLAVDDPSSPHLAADRIAATVYVAGAIEDSSYTEKQAELLEDALTSAGVAHTLEFYPAHHGFAVPDNPSYDAEAEARHWEALRQLYQAHLHGS
jgi:carboxymethylenebutenolidase